MALNFDLIGKPSDPLTHKYAWKDCVLYALGVGATTAAELDFLFVMNGPKVLPTFAVVPSFSAMLSVCGRLGANMAMVVHGEQAINLLRPIPPSGSLETRAVVEGIFDKGKGALAVVRADTTDERGEPLFTNKFSIFIRGAGGFGGERGPDAGSGELPTRAPDFAVTETTSPDQAALYRLSGDYNPLHISPMFATQVGFARPILHGLCTYGIAGRAVLRHAAGGNVAKLTSFGARFAAPVFPGDTLTTEGWANGDGTFAVQVKNQDGKAVLSHSTATIAAA